MTDKKRPPESDGKEEDDGAASPDALMPTSMERFKSLARRVVSVSKGDLQKELDRHDAKKTKRRKS